MYRYDLVVTGAGAYIGRVQPESGTWERKLNGMGSGSHTFPKIAGGYGKTGWRDWTRTWVRTLVVSLVLDSFGTEYTAVYAGIITARKYDANTGKLTIQHSDVRSIFERRNTFGENGYSSDTDGHDGDFPIGNPQSFESHTGILSLRAVASKLLWSGLIGPQDNYVLPLIRLNDEEPGSYARWYWDYNLTHIGPALEEIQDAGPDIDFVPTWLEDKSGLTWVMVGGADTQFDIISGVIDIKVQGPDTQVTDLEYIEEGSYQVSTVYAVGEGSGSKMVVQAARLFDPDIPAIDRIISFKGIAARNQLQMHAEAELAAFNQTTDQFSLSMLASMNPDCLKIGMVFRFTVVDDEWIPDGVYTQRVIGMSGDVGDIVKFDIQHINVPWLA